MQVDMPQLFFAVAFILLLILITGSILVRPLRFLMKLVFNSLVGLILLVVFNFIGGFVDFTIPVNLITVLVAGFLGLPGLILLILLQILGI